MTFGRSFLVLLMMSHFSKGLLLTVSEGEDVTLNCTYSRGELPPGATFVWKFQGGKALPSSTSSSLNLTRVTTSQSGTYQCHIFDVRFQQDVELIVTAKKPEVVKPAGGAAVPHLSVYYMAVTLLYFFYLFI